MIEYDKPLATIKSWAEDDRPREKLVAKGPSNLTDAELLAILIASGSRNESAVDLCKRILASVGNNLGELAKLSVNDLMKFKGIGDAKAITIVAALELGKRRRLAEATKREAITCSKDGYDILLPLFEDLKHEEFWVLLLNRANKVVRKERISTGGVAGTIVDNKIILKLAIETLASGMLLAHNHPSGNLKPSQADINLTRQIKQAAQLLEVNLVDHLIVTDHGYFSFADEGML
ncbi:MAG: DNA repair protein RadC [Sphingobacteriales bacterium JAD_PAG50586_3]|nr:MAG: DNA repair protein RadC [Sphingobacteriales bacterium JAD_PAG50586_3]